MSAEFEFHPEALLVTPLFYIACGECDDPLCGEGHWKITLGWLLWDVSFVFSDGGGKAA